MLVFLHIYYFWVKRVLNILGICVRSALKCYHFFFCITSFSPNFPKCQLDLFKLLEELSTLFYILKLACSHVWLVLLCLTGESNAIPWPMLLTRNPGYSLLWDSVSWSPNDRAKAFVTPRTVLWHLFSVHCCFVGEHCLFELAMPSSLGPSSVAAALQEALENSARLIDRHLQEDRCFPDLSELLNVPSHSKSPPGCHSHHTL